MRDFPPPTLRPLTPREAECLRWAAAGRSSAETARILRSTEHAVDGHLRRAQQKLGATSLRLAVVMALRNGVIDL